VKCPKDGGEILVKRSRRGATFYGCSNYPSCDFTTWHKPLERICPRCNQYPLGVESFRGRETGKIKCTDPDCGYEEPAGAELAGINAN
jgi:DNA topoisomerase-1